MLKMLNSFETSNEYNISLKVCEASLQWNGDDV